MNLSHRREWGKDDESLTLETSHLRLSRDESVSAVASEFGYPVYAQQDSLLG
ncbi:hypothetical protein W02_26040 [Nitrospira sp. KM1]|uniref:hypothetical protein n=1 Tax=Nitrospira sp. KM1 TaxID=1936990 RepID=UPI0013A7AF21|nr:hypothetical protein [Nitrospira sp. KM1]BCA55464.1 hypothetical protein W02_26040 [Nitrospira sp. KM1]